MYGCEVWGYGNVEPMEIFFRKFIKRVLGINRSTPNCIVYAEVGKYPIIHQIYSRMISFWVKISEGKTSKLSTIMYNIIFKLHLEGSYNSPWLLFIKSIITNSGNPFFWDEQEHLAPKAFMKDVISAQLKLQFTQEWEFEIFRNRKCVSYRIFKDEIKSEPYLAKLDFVDRRALCKFRTGNHKLPVAKSRYNEGGGGVDVKCKLCESNDICDEFHVLFICKYFDEQRKKYLKRNHYTKPSTLKMYTLFHSHGQQLLNLAKFVRCILSKF